MKRFLSLNFFLVFTLVYIELSVHSNMPFQHSIEDSILKYKDADPLLAKNFAYSFLNKSLKNENKKNIVKAFNHLGYINFVLSHTDSAYYFYDKAIIESFNINDEKLILFSKKNKAAFLYQNYDFNNALELYNDALSLAEKLKDKESQTAINITISRLKYETGSYEEALELFKENYTKETPDLLLHILNLYLAKTYLKTNQADSSFQYIKKGMDFFKTNNDKDLEIHFLNVKGEYFMAKERYDDAQLVLNKAIKTAEEINNERLKYLVLLTLAKLNVAQGNILESIKNLSSITTKQDEIKFAPEELSEYYKLLAINYKNIDSIKQSNYYYQKFIEEENKKQNKKINTIQDLYELDLKKVKDENVSFSKQKKILSVLIAVLIALLSFFFIINRKKQKLNQVKFNALMEKVSLYETQMHKKEKSADDNNNTSENIEAQDNSFIIKDKTISDVLENLKRLEEKKHYLKQDFTLHYVAKRLKTNTAYLSKIINTELGKTFSTYLNELRINYIILELKNNPKMRAYSISAIAEELGYKRPEAFTKYFKAATGLTPAVFIKKINDLHKKKSL